MLTFVRNGCRYAVVLLIDNRCICGRHVSSNSFFSMDTSYMNIYIKLLYYIKSYAVILYLTCEYLKHEACWVFLIFKRFNCQRLDKYRNTLNKVLKLVSPKEF